MQPSLIASTVLLLAATSAAGDTVKLVGKPPFRNVIVTDFRAGRLVFRGISRQYLRKPLREIEWLEISDQPALSMAERAGATGDWPAALAGYGQALAGNPTPWMRDLIHLRLLRAADRSGRFDRAVAVYLDLVASRPTLATGHRPTRPGPIGSEVNRQAWALLEGTLQANLASAPADAARTLLLELLLYEDVDPLPTPFRTAGSTRAAASATSQPLGILPAAPVDSPDGSRWEQPPELSADSLVLHAARKALEAGDAARAARLVERALPFVPTDARGPWRLALGHARIELGQPAEAAADLLNLAETEPDPDLATRALYYVGLAHERLGRPDAAEALYREILTRDDAPEDVKAQAREAQTRLKSPLETDG